MKEPSSGEGSPESANPPKSNRGHRLVLAAVWACALGAVLWYSFSNRSGHTAAVDARGVERISFASLDASEASARFAGVSNQAIAPEFEAGQFRFGARHVGRFPRSLTASPAAIWSKDLGGPVRAQPVFDAQENIYIASLDGSLYSFNKDGELRWKTSLEGPSYSTPLLVGSRLFVGSDAHRVFSVDSTSGRVIAKLDTDEDADTAIVSHNGRELYFGSGTDLYRTDLELRVQLRVQLGGKIFSSPTLDPDGTIYVGAEDGRLYCISPQGRLRWSHLVGSDIDSTVVLADDGRLFLGSDAQRVSVFGRDGSLLANHETGGYVRASMAVSSMGSLGTRLLVPVLGPDPVLLGLQLSTDNAIEAAFAYRLKTVDSREFGLSSAPIADAEGASYFAADDGHFYSLDPQGNLRSSYDVHVPIDSDLGISNEGRVAFVSRARILYVLK